MRAELTEFVYLINQGPLAGRVCVGDDDPDIGMPRVVVVPGRNADVQDRHTGAQRREVLQFTVMSVGSTLDQASWADEVVDRVLRPDGRGRVLDVPGRSCSRLSRRASDLAADDSGPRVWAAITSYAFTSTPA